MPRARLWKHPTGLPPGVPRLYTKTNTMKKFGPTKAELKFRSIVGVTGLGMVAGALAYRGLPTSAGGWEAIVIATVFFGGTLAWSIRKLMRGDHSDGP